MNLPLIYKRSTRYSALNRPSIGAAVSFSPITIFHPSPLINAPKAHLISEDRSWLKIGAIGSVVGIRPHLIEVRFHGAPSTDLISPEFLTSKLELTSFGRSLMAASDLQGKL